MKGLIILKYRINIPKIVIDPENNTTISLRKQSIFECTLPKKTKEGKRLKKFNSKDVDYYLKENLSSTLNIPNPKIDNIKLNVENIYKIENVNEDENKEHNKTIQENIVIEIPNYDNITISIDNISKSENSKVSVNEIKRKGKIIQTLIDEENYLNSVMIDDIVTILNESIFKFF
jgi:hypothetical protein